MDRIGPGTLLAGRYRLAEQVQTDPVAALWRAEDLTLERPVGVRVLAPAHPRMRATLDAARRAALVADPRLQRVLGVGVESGSGYVVLEWVAGRGAQSLAGRVDAEEALRVTTEATEALRAAAARDLHHGRLGPNQVVRASDGTVRVTGTAVDSAAAGQATPAAAARPEARDVRGLAAVLYALLTGRWPYGAAEGLPAAPTDKGRPVPASQLREDLPGALDQLLTAALGTGAGGEQRIETLEDLLTRLHAARAAVRPVEATTAPTPVAAAAGAADAAAEEPDDTDVITPVRGTPGDEDGPAGTTAPGAAGASRAPDAGPAAGAAGAVAAGVAAAGAAGPPGGPPPAPQPGPQPEPTWTDDEDWSILPGGESYADDGSYWDDQQYADDGWQEQGTWASSYDEHGQAYDPAYDPAYAGGQQWDGASWEGWSDSDAAAGAGAAGAAGAARGGPGTGGTGGASPVVPGGRGPRGPRGPRRRPAGAGAGVAVVLVMGAFVVAALVYGLDRLRQPEVAAPDVPVVTATVTPTAEPSPEPSPVPSPEPEATDDAEPQFVSPAGVQPLDPFGDGEENDQDAPRAIDGDPGTSWGTQRYNSQAFGGLKEGLGLALDLGEPRDVTAVSLVAPGSGGTLEVRTASDASFEGSTVVGSTTTGSGEQVVELDEPVPTQFVVLWFTELPENDGEWRALVSEVQVQVAP